MAETHHNIDETNK